MPVEHDGRSKEWQSGEPQMIVEAGRERATTAASQLRSETESDSNGKVILGAEGAADGCER